MTSVPRVLAIATATEAPLVQAVRQTAGLELVAVTSASPAEARRAAGLCDVDAEDDLRAALRRDDVDVLWIATPGALDADVRRALRDTDLVTVTSDPPLGPVSELLTEPEGGMTARFVPLLRRTPGYLEARDALEDIGTARGVWIESSAAAGQVSLWALLFDAMDVVVTLCGDPDLIHAALGGPRPVITEDVALLRGHLAAALRFPDGRCASIAVSDAACAWSRRATVLGDQGTLVVTDLDSAVQTHAAAGAEASAGAEPSAGADTTSGAATSTTPLGATHGTADPAALVAAQIIRLAEGVDHADPLPDHARLLTLCEAARLSCLTGQGEAPQDVRRMLGGV